MSENAAADGGTRPRLLFLAHLLPWPLDGGGQIKSYHTLRLLASRYDIRLLAFIRRPEERENVGPLEPLCAAGIKLIPLPRGRGRDIGIAAASLAGGRSFIIARDSAPAMYNAVNAELENRRGPRYAAVHVDHLQMAQFVPGNTHRAKVVLDQHNIEHRIPQRLAETPGTHLLTRWYARGEWSLLRDFELDACRRADRVLVVSEEDRDGFLVLDPTLAPRLAVTPIGVDMDYWGGVLRRPDARDLLSVGTMYWPPNVDSMQWFCADILPRVRAEIPGVRLNIVGARPTPAVRALGEADLDVVVTGSVPDVRPYGENCGVFVVPLRSGSGMRVKILTAMAMGLPVVSTTVGAEGIDVTNGENILLADTLEAFAAAVVRLLRDPAGAERMGEAGRRLMARAYGWDAVGKRLLSVYDELLADSPSSESRKG
jgi:glycosyltransferase involved in cell wall biosynthesis